MAAFNPDYDVESLPDLYLDPAQVERCRELASQVFRGVYDFIVRHSTVSVERTVLRLFGIAGAGARGVPLCNLMVERMAAHAGLSRGAAYWYGRALRAGMRSPSEIVEALPGLVASGPLPADDERALREEVRREARAAADELASRIRARDELRESLGSGAPPLKYVIVATGNIHDDVE